MVYRPRMRCHGCLDVYDESDEQNFVTEHNAPVRGFHCHKARGAKSDHTGEVKMVRDAVRHPQKLAPRIIAAKNLKLREDDDLQSAFRIMGLDFGEPAVITF